MRKISAFLILVLLCGGCALEKLSSDYWSSQSEVVSQMPPAPAPEDQMEPLHENSSVEQEAELYLASEETEPQEQLQNKELDNLFIKAEQFYTKGFAYTKDGKWDLAEDEFENALELLQNSILKDTYPDEVNDFYNRLSRDILDILEEKESEDIKTRENILLARIKAKPEEERTIREKVTLDLKELDYDIPIEINDKVIKYIEFFSTDTKDKFQLWLSRSGSYLPLLRQILKEEGMPLDLAYLPLIESGFNPRAYSRARAAGLWQFIPGTGKLYGLDITWWVDERRDFEKATRSAASYLRFLYDSFGSWYLALASYNAGEGRVGRTIQKQNTADFWELNLPRETMNYVPAFIASVIIAKNPEHYGLEVNYEPPLEYDTITIDRSIDLETVAKCAETEKDEIKRLNPEIGSWATPPVKSYQLRVPKGKKEIFASKFDKIKDSFQLAWATYKIQKNDTLHIISRRFGVSVAAIAAANKISNPNTIQIGRTIIVPNKWTNQKVEFSDFASSAQKGELVIHTVRRGETVSRLAKVYGTTVSSIVRWNNLKSPSSLAINQKLKIYARASFEETSQTSKVASKSSNNSTGQGSYITHSIRKGETLSHIARKYGVKISDLIEWNRIKSAKGLQPNQKIKIYQRLISSAGGEG